ncbi:MAG: hypothetical protein SA378_04000 [Sedimentibacter sp.]|uniref:hypothetical protein n=1 Tax=Sedimentibacter sp. TaxID=1960295 RepID=UPI002982760E|nr:hypothetical protein [Sedimentibacter sp.]MDW5299285.1 hypothetical protein [Sedimentibacter sp.]
MARRRSNMYGKKRKMKYGRIFGLTAVIILIVYLIFAVFKKDDYVTALDDVLNSEIVEISGTVSSVSAVDINVYSNDGIRYKNQHKNIKRLNSFDGTVSDDLDKAETAKILMENLTDAKETSLITALPEKENGYYWLEVNFVIENKTLIFENNEEYNFDLYYDIEDEKIYVKEKYYNEYSKKNNKLELQGYEADEEFKKLITELTKTVQ